MTPPKFIGITIGPIYLTFQKAEKTREIWGASYLFSYLCRRLVFGLDRERFEIILPHPSQCNPEATNSRPGVGLYPDRIMVRTDDKGFENVKAIVKATKEAVIKDLVDSMSGYPAYDPFAALLEEFINNDYEGVKDFLRAYLQVYTVEIPEAELKLKSVDNEGTEILLSEVISMNVLLDHAELRRSIASFDPDPIKIFLRGINHSFLLKDAFDGKFEHFPSLPEITTTELRFLADEHIRRTYDSIVQRQYTELVEEERRQWAAYKAGQGSREVERRSMRSDDAEDELLDLLFHLDGVGEHRRTYHKYVAIVHADGDRIGKLIGRLEPKDVSGFSKDLIDFAMAANKVLAGTRFKEGSKEDWGYGGAPIYIGGDDLVFFAPVASRVKDEDGNQQFQTIFHLIKDLDTKFNEIFNSTGKYEYLKPEDRPCLTYGVSISYVKHPLKEAFKESLDLMHAVKSDRYKTRNRVNIKVRKHSGQWFGGVIDKNDTDAWKMLMNLLDEHNTSSLKGDKAATFLNSVSQKLRYYQPAIEKWALGGKKEELQKSMAALFINALDEEIHGDEKVRKYLDSIRDLLVQMLTYAPKTEDQVRGDLDCLHGILRFIHFIRDNEFKNEKRPRKHETEILS